MHKNLITFAIEWTRLLFRKKDKQIKIKQNEQQIYALGISMLIGFGSNVLM